MCCLQLWLLDVLNLAAAAFYALGGTLLIMAEVSIWLLPGDDEF